MADIHAVVLGRCLLTTMITPHAHHPFFERSDLVLVGYKMEPKAFSFSKVLGSSKVFLGWVTKCSPFWLGIQIKRTWMSAVYTPLVDCLGISYFTCCVPEVEIAISIKPSGKNIPVGRILSPFQIDRANRIGESPSFCD